MEIHNSVGDLSGIAGATPVDLEQRADACSASQQTRPSQDQDVALEPKLGAVAEDDERVQAPQCPLDSVRTEATSSRILREGKEHIMIDGGGGGATGVGDAGGGGAGSGDGDTGEAMNVALIESTTSMTAAQRPGDDNHLPYAGSLIFQKPRIAEEKTKALGPREPTQPIKPPQAWAQTPPTGTPREGRPSPRRASLASREQAAQAPAAAPPRRKSYLQTDGTMPASWKDSAAEAYPLACGDAESASSRALAKDLAHRCTMTVQSSSELPKEAAALPEGGAASRSPAYVKRFKGYSDAMTEAELVEEAEASGPDVDGASRARRATNSVDQGDNDNEMATGHLLIRPITDRPRTVQPAVMSAAGEVRRCCTSRVSARAPAAAAVARQREAHGARTAAAMASTRGASRGDSIGTASRAPDAELPPDSKDVDDAVLSKHRIVGAAACTSACTCTRTRAVDSSRPVRGQTVPHAVMHTAIEGFASLQDPVLGPVVTGRASSPEPNAPLARLGPSTRPVHGVSAFATHDQNVQHSARDAFQRGGSSGFRGAGPTLPREHRQRLALGLPPSPRQESCCASCDLETTSAAALLDSREMAAARTPRLSSCSRPTPATAAVPAAVAVAAAAAATTRTTTAPALSVLRSTATTPRAAPSTARDGGGRARERVQARTWAEHALLPSADLVPSMAPGPEPARVTHTPMSMSMHRASNAPIDRYEQQPQPPPPSQPQQPQQPQQQPQQQQQQQQRRVRPGVLPATLAAEVRGMLAVGPEEGFIPPPRGRSTGSSPRGFAALAASPASRSRPRTSVYPPLAGAWADQLATGTTSASNVSTPAVELPLQREALTPGAERSRDRHVHRTKGARLFVG